MCLDVGIIGADQETTYQRCAWEVGEVELNECHIIRKQYI